MAEFPAQGTTCGECGCCPAAVFSGGVPVCWACDEGKPCKSRQSSAPVRVTRAATTEPATPKPVVKPRKAPMTAIPPKANLPRAAAMIGAASAAAMIGAAKAVVSAAVRDQPAEPESAEPLPTELNQPVPLASTAEADLPPAIRPDWTRAHLAPAPNHYAAVIADLEEKRADLIADLDAIDRCLPILRVIEARKPATANQPERLHA
jgi:hypothetical protein